MDESHLAECIKDLEQGRFDLATISEWQAKRLDEEYNWDNVAEKYSSLFKDLLNKK
jgi:glycosyltransferase involved in cell wall biosynthesis